MADSQQLLNTLKQQLRAQSIHYAAVAKHLGLSEASVKRMFASGHISLSRLSEVCGMVGWDIGELAEAAREREQRIDRLSDAQETQIAEDVVLLLVAISVINGFNYSDLIEQYSLDEHECIRKLAQLDRLHLIDLLPGNRIKLKISPNFSWNPRGPIQKFFLSKVVDQFFDSDFSGEQEKLIVMNGMLSRDEHKELQSQLMQLSQKFTKIARAKNTEEVKYKNGSTIVLALRAWRFPMFTPFMSNTK